MRPLRFLSPAIGALATFSAAAVANATAVNGQLAVRPTRAILFLELVINDQANGDIVEVVAEGDRLWINGDALRALHLDIDAQGPVDVTKLPRVRATYDAAGQRLLLSVPAAMLPLQRIAGEVPIRLASRADPGALLNYDLYVQHSGNITVASLWSEQRLFAPIGSLANTGTLRRDRGGHIRYTRYDTTYRRIDERRALSIGAGDLITQALPWTSAVRIGGLQVTRRFRVRPDLVTTPLPVFAGQAAVPSGVDLFINGYRQRHTDVAPGRFVLDEIPGVSGAGEARIVTTDAVGRQIATTIPFYVSPDLLRPGLVDFAVETGVLRRGYGIVDFAYGPPVASGSVRYGLSRRLTIEGHAEATRRFAMFGGGGVWAPGLWGTVHGSIALSRRGAAIGTRFTIGYSYANPRFSIDAEHGERSRHFTDFGDFDLAKWRGRARSNRLSGSVVIDRFGAIGFGYIDAYAGDGVRARLLSASASAPMSNRLTIFAAVDYDAGRNALGGRVRAMMPLGRSTIGAGVAIEPRHGPLAQFDYTRAVPSDGGLGIAANGAVSLRGTLIGQVTTTIRGPAAQFSAGASATPGGKAVWGSVSGSIAVLDGRPYLANQIPDAFAVVATGVPRVPVYYENQLIGRTGRGGVLLVPNVTAYHANRFSIALADLPASMQANVVDTRAAFREGMGAVIRMPVRESRSVTVALIDASGHALEPGAVAVLSGGARTIVGWDGVVLLEDRTGTMSLTVTNRWGVCRAMVTIPADVAPLANLGKVACR